MERKLSLLSWVPTRMTRTLLLTCLGASQPGLFGQEMVLAPIRFELTPPDYRLELFPRVFAPAQRHLVLALGGGGAKGIAHAGVLQRLQEEGIPVSGIAGTSMGACIGSMYAAGYSGFAIENLLKEVDLGALLLDRQHRLPGKTLWEQENERITFLSLEYKPGSGFAFSPGISSGLDVRRALQILLNRSSYRGSDSFDELRVPFRAVATNIQTGRAAAPSHGELSTVVRASMSIPGIFNPVILGEQQHVDGMLVQNLPVETAKSLDPHAAVIAVEVGGNLEAVRLNSILGLAFRTLDVSIEERTEFSRRAADLLLRPTTDTIPHLEFHRQVSAAIQEGRRAFDGQLDAIEDLLYGLDGASPAPGGTLALLVPAALEGRIRALIKTTLPQGPRLRRHYLRMLRRIYAGGLAQRAEIRFAPEGPILDVEPYPMVNRIEVQAPEEWRESLARALSEAQVKTGVAFNPVNLGQALDGFCLRVTLRGRLAVYTEGTTFDSAKGVLHLKINEPVPKVIQVQEGILSQAQTTYIRNLFAPFEGCPVDVPAFTRRFQLAEKRLGLEELRATADHDRSGARLLLTPVPEDRTTVDGIFAYESTWEAHVGASAHSNRLFGSDCGFGFQASTNKLRDAVDLEVTRVFGVWPRLGWRMSGAQTVQRFLPEALRPPSLLSSSALLMERGSLRERNLGLGIFARFGMEDRGLLSLECTRRWNDIHPTASGWAMPRMDQIQLMGEWDSFDRYLFPTKGTLMRLKLGGGWLPSGDTGTDGKTYHFVYVRARNLWPMGAWVSLEGDLESGLGWDLPLARWYSVGGPSFMAGTASAGFLTPNFAVARVGFPIRVVNMFGVNLQVVPRFDVGYLGGPKPSHLQDGTFARGLGASLRSEIGRWYCEVAVGRWSGTDAGIVEKTRINVLLGAHPFDLWRER